MTTIHSYTGDQPTLDTMHKDLYRARAAALSMIPTSTGAAKAVGLVLPELNGRLDGYAIRVPTPNVSAVDLKFVAKRATTKEEVNEAIKAAAEGPLKGVLDYTTEKLVSCDFNHNPASSTFHMDQTKVLDGTLVSILSWYDNEWGFSGAHDGHGRGDREGAARAYNGSSASPPSPASCWASRSSLVAAASKLLASRASIAGVAALAGVDLFPQRGDLRLQRLDLRARVGGLVGDLDRRHHDQALVADLADIVAHRRDFAVDGRRQLLQPLLLALVAAKAVGAAGDGDDCDRHGQGPYSSRGGATPSTEATLALARSTRRKTSSRVFSTVAARARAASRSSASRPRSSCMTASSSSRSASDISFSNRCATAVSSASSPRSKRARAASSRGGRLAASGIGADGIGGEKP